MISTYDQGEDIQEFTYLGSISFPFVGFDVSRITIDYIAHDRIGPTFNRTWLSVTPDASDCLPCQQVRKCVKDSKIYIKYQFICY